MLDVGDRVAEEGGERLGHLRDVRQPRRERLAADALEGVVEEVGVDLVLQREVLGLLFGGGDQLVGVELGAQAEHRVLHLGAERVAQVVDALHRIAAHKELEDLFVS